MKIVSTRSGRKSLVVAVFICSIFLLSSIYILPRIGTKTLIQASFSGLREEEYQSMLKLVDCLETQIDTHIENYTDLKLYNNDQNGSYKIQNQEDVLDLNTKHFDPTMENIELNSFSNKQKYYLRSKETKQLFQNVKTNTYNNVPDNVTKDYSQKMISLKQRVECSNKSGISVNIDYKILANILKIKLESVVLMKVRKHTPTCENDIQLANSCDNKKCLQKVLPKSLSTRIKQLITPCKLQITAEDQDIMLEMADRIKGNYDIILLTAASSNHFLESQALLKNLHENVFPYLQNFTLIFYNLGLTEQERSLMIKYCQCQVIDFPFDKFPNLMTNLKCYSWKPVLIKSNLQKANVVFWIDASIRFHNSSNNLQALIQKTRERGVQIGGSSAESNFRTFQSMYHFFGDESCAYVNYYQAKAAFGVFHREYFVDRVILEPWVACALNKDCMCPTTNTTYDCEKSKQMETEYYKGRGSFVYGMCHRFDQSAISLIIHKLYQDFYRWVMVNTASVLAIRRRHTLTYFPSQK